MTKLKTLSFFISRIGKRIYRNHRKCCRQCDEVNKNGLIIRDEQHARYLHEIEHTFANEMGVYLNYRDKKIST